MTGLGPSMRWNVAIAITRLLIIEFDQHTFGTVVNQNGLYECLARYSADCSWKNWNAFTSSAFTKGLAGPGFSLKTQVFGSYPSHLRPLLVQRRHAGRCCDTCQYMACRQNKGKLGGGRRHAVDK